MNDPFLDFMMMGLAGSVTPPVSPLEKARADCRKRQDEQKAFKDVLNHIVEHIAEHDDSAAILLQTEKLTDSIMNGLEPFIFERDNAAIMSQRPEVIKFLDKMQDEVNTFLSTHKVN